MAEHISHKAIPDHPQDRNLNPDMEDGTSCRKDRIEPYHRILANNTYKMFVSPTHSVHWHVTRLFHNYGGTGRFHLFQSSQISGFSS